MPKRKIYTYYQPVEVPEQSVEEATRLLLLWRENWSAHGYDPIVLNQHIAAQHPRYDLYVERVRKFPTVNPPDYDFACFLRYLAMEVVKGGILCDWDVFCYADLHLAKTPFTTLMNYQAHVPSFMLGNEVAYRKVVETIYNYKTSIKDVNERGVAHVSDMYIFLRAEAPFYQSCSTVMNYGEPDWEKAQLVHYSAGSMLQHKPRSRYIRKLRNWK